MLFFSEVTGKTYKSVEELEKAEKEVSEKESAREASEAKVKEAGEKVKTAYAAYEEVKNEYYKILEEHCKKYDSYKTSAKSIEARLIDPDTFFHTFGFRNF